MADTDARLVAVLDADINKLIEKLNSANRATYGAAANIQKHLDGMDQRWNKMFGSFEPAKALDNVFSRSRFALIEEGGQKLSVFGAALEDLGPAGLAAGAALAAVGIGLEETHKALEYADGIYKVSKQAHVTTDELQSMQAAVAKAGGNADSAGQSLGEFSATLGKAQEGLARSQKAFLALGFSKQQVQDFKETGEALDLVVARIQELRSPSQQAAVIQQLGLEGLKPLILEGADAWRTYREEAKASGLVLDSDVVQRAHGLNVEAEELTKKIKNELTTAFVDLGPVLVSLLGFLAKAADAVKTIAENMNALRGAGDDNGVRFGGAVIGADGSVSSRLDASRSAYARSDHGVSTGISEDQLQAGLGVKGGRKLIPQGRTTEKDVNGLIGAAAQSLEEALKAEATAAAGLTANIQAHADLEKEAVDSELAKSLVKLQTERQDAQKKLTGAAKVAALAVLDQAETAQKTAAGDKKALIDRQAQWALEDQGTELINATIAAELAALQAKQKFATTAAERARLAETILGIEQEQAADAFKVKTARSVQSGALTPADAQRLTSDFLARQQTERALQVFENSGPLAKYIQSIQDLNTEFQSSGVTASRDLAQGLSQATFEAKNLGDIGRNVFIKLGEDLESAFLEKTVTGPLASSIASAAGSIFHFASGTDSSPGGPAVVGEFGKEVVNLPVGAQVIPNDVLRGIAGLDLSRLGGRGAAPISVALHIDASGAFDLATLQRVTAAGVQQAVQMARVSTMADAQRRAQNSYF